MTMHPALHSGCEPQRWSCPSQKSFMGHRSSWVLVLALVLGWGWGGSSLYCVSSSAPARHHLPPLIPTPNTPAPSTSSPREPGGFTSCSWDLIHQWVKKGQILG